MDAEMRFKFIVVFDGGSEFACDYASAKEAESAAHYWLMQEETPVKSITIEIGPIMA